ncbi:MAG: polysaccharide biosynthesis/export family protein [Terriglobales bacterium]
MRNNVVGIGALLCVVLLAICAGVAQNPPVQAALPGANAEPAAPAKTAAPAVAEGRFNPASPNYVIGESDVLMINVWKETELSRSVPVRPDGRISLPLVGEVIAAGKTPPQLQEAIAAELKNFMSEPEVTVIVQDPRSKHFNVVGEVARPGSFTLTQPVSVIDAVALAGGFRDFAKTKKMYILRTIVAGQKARIPVNYKKAVRGDLSQDVMLQPGDTLVVP